MIITNFVKGNATKENNLKVFKKKVENLVISTLALEEFTLGISQMLEGNAIISITSAQKTAAETKYATLKADVLTKVNALD